MASRLCYFIDETIVVAAVFVRSPFQTVREPARYIARNTVAPKYSDRKKKEGRKKNLSLACRASKHKNNVRTDFGHCAQRPPSPPLVPIHRVYPLHDPSKAHAAVAGRYRPRSKPDSASQKRSQPRYAPEHGQHAMNEYHQPRSRVPKPLPWEDQDGATGARRGRAGELSGWREFRLR